MYTKTILIVDDEPVARQGIKRTIERWSEGRVQVLSASSGEDALKLLERNTVHLLITDIRMPEITGLKLLELIDNMKCKPAVIIISAYPEFEYAQEAIQLGVLNYLLKPLNKNKLIKSVEEALQTYDNKEKAGLFQKIVDSNLAEVKNNDFHLSSSILTAIDYVEGHLKEQLSLKTVADYVHLNPSYFSSLFKEQTKLTFSEYVTRSRIQSSKNLLLSTDLTIEDISARVGYHTAKYFNKLFKEYEGLTPSQFRKQVLND